MILSVQYPSDLRAEYRTSAPEVSLICECHPQVHGGTGRRTGLHDDENGVARPVYVLIPTTHREHLHALTYMRPDGSLELLREAPARTVLSAISDVPEPQLTHPQRIARRVLSAGAAIGNRDWDRVADAQAIIELERENDRLNRESVAYRSALVECVKRMQSARYGRARVPFKDMQALLGDPLHAPRLWESK